MPNLLSLDTHAEARHLDVEAVVEVELMLHGFVDVLELELALLELVILVDVVELEESLTSGPSCDGDVVELSELIVLVEVLELELVLLKVVELFMLVLLEPVDVMDVEAVVVDVVWKPTYEDQAVKFTRQEAYVMAKFCQTHVRIDFT
eukprot:4974625-Amphidinium_carterae.1